MGLFFKNPMIPHPLRRKRGAESSLLSGIAATDCLLVPGRTMRFAFLCRGNRRRTKVEPAHEKSLKKAVHCSAVIPDLGSPLPRRRIPPLR